jgi:carboxypeptidase Q
MHTRRLFILAFATLLTTALLDFPLGAAQESIDYESLSAIGTYGLDEDTSEVMDIASWLTDVYGPRLSGSPNIREAGDWAVGKMREWGLTNVTLEPWTENRGFSRGWANEKFYLAAVEPQPFPMYAMSEAWTPGTDGLVSGPAVLVTGTTEEDLAPFTGQLDGAFVLIQEPVDVAAYWTPQARRLTDGQLDDLELSRGRPPEFGTAPAGARGRGGRGRGRGGPSFDRMAFFKAEGVTAVLSTNARGHGLFLSSGNRQSDPDTTVATIRVAAEHYNRIARMLEKDLPVTLEADIRNVFHPDPDMFNVVGEIAGSDKADEVVMLGAHFDSWHPGTGATDNAAGSAVMLEAMRILKETGVPLRRTVRIGLWNGEEQGLHGSRNYVEAHFAACQPDPDAEPGDAPAGRGRGTIPGTFALTPEHERFSSYFNVDNGTGAIRGVYLQANSAVAPVFRAWIEPLRAVGITHLSIRGTGGTDHLSFDAVGLPGFQFIQDDIEYDTVTHHYNMDTYERLQPDDMRRNATIVAAFAFLAANREERLPRKPLPSCSAPAPGGRGN